MPNEEQKRKAIDGLAQRVVKEARNQGVKITHEQARKEVAIPAAVRNDRRR